MKKLSITNFILLLAALGFGGSAHATLNVLTCEPEWASLAQELGGDKVSASSATAC